MDRFFQKNEEEGPHTSCIEKGKASVSKATKGEMNFSLTRSRVRELGGQGESRHRERLLRVKRGVSDLEGGKTKKMNIKGEAANHDWNRKSLEREIEKNNGVGERKLHNPRPEGLRREVLSSKRRRG